MPARGAIICGAGTLTSVGRGARQTCTSVRARVSRFAESSLCDARSEPFVVAEVPDEALPELDAAVENMPGLTDRQRRLLRLAAPALQQVLERVDRPGSTSKTPLFLATPEVHPGLPEPVSSEFLEHLEIQLAACGVSFDRARSVVVSTGRAGGLITVAKAVEFLESGGGDYAVAGGVDSFLDPALLSALDTEERIQSPAVMDGFIPGEGAGMLLLARAGAPPVEHLEPIARLMGVQSATEPGHRYSGSPYRGDGLASAFGDLLTNPEVLRTPVRTIFAGLNGENFGAKEFGVASLRSRRELRPDAVVEHPVDCFGDIGAALGPVMLGLAALGIQRNAHAAPSLVWCSSEGPDRAAAVVDRLDRDGSASAAQAAADASAVDRSVAGVGRKE